MCLTALGEEAPLGGSTRMWAEDCWKDCWYAGVRKISQRLYLRFKVNPQ